MNLLNSTASSLNAERSRVDAATPAAPGAEGGGSQAFGDLLKGLSAPSPVPSQAYTAASARPPEPDLHRAADVSDSNTSPQQAAGPHEADAAPSRTSASTKAATTSDRAAQDAAESDGERDEGDAAVDDDGGERSPTLAHWLFGSAAERGVTGDAMPAPANAAPADETGAATLTRQLLSGLRGARGLEGGGSTAAVRNEADVAPRDAAAAGATLSADAAGSKSHFASTLALQTASADEGKTTAALPALAPATGAGMDPAALAAALGSSANGAVTAPTPMAFAADVPVATPVGAPGFADDVAQALHGLTMTSQQGVHEARLQLNPAELGPVQVRIEVVDGTARVELGAAHAATRQLLESSMSTLASSLQSDGLTLASASVGDWQGGFSAGAGAGDQRGGQPGGQAQGRSEHGGGWWGGPEPSRAEAAAGWAADGAASQPLSGRRSGGLDLYA